MKSIHDRALAVISEQVGDPDVTLSLETNLVDDLGLDSLDLLECLMSVENEFEIEIDDTKAESVKTIGDAVTLVTETIEGAKSC